MATAHNYLPLGSVRIRTRHKRGGVRRAWVKTAEPNVWKLRAVVVWEAANGPVPAGKIIHHKDEDTLNDDPANLESVTKARHLAIHMPEYRQTVVRKLVKARRKLRWSTLSATKITGRHPNNCACPLHAN